MELIGFLVDNAGKLMVAYTAIKVHHRFLNEHQVDEAVFRAMQREQKLGVIGMVLIIVGTALQIPAFF